MVQDSFQCIEVVFFIDRIRNDQPLDSYQKHKVMIKNLKKYQYYQITTFLQMSIVRKNLSDLVKIIILLRSFNVKI